MNVDTKKKSVTHQNTQLIKDQINLEAIITYKQGQRTIIIEIVSKETGKLINKRKKTNSLTRKKNMRN